MEVHVSGREVDGDDKLLFFLTNKHRAHTHFTMINLHTLVDSLGRAFAADEGARRRRKTLMVMTNYCFFTHTNIKHTHKW